MKKRRIVFVCIVAVVALVVLLFVFFRPNRSAPPAEPRLDTENPSLADLENGATGTLSTTPTVSGSSSSSSEFVSIDIMVESLKRWVKSREGKDLELVDIQPVKNLSGVQTSANVIMTSLLGGQLTPVQLRQKLSENRLLEQDLREQVKICVQKGDNESVNRLMGEIVGLRTDFIEKNEVVSYKLSLSKNEPPVLAFWPGLPFEAVRKPNARKIAETQLGQDISLIDYVQYSPVCSLIRFENESGDSVYVDPYNLVEIPEHVVRVAEEKRSNRRNDNERDERIATQWGEFIWD